MPPKPKSSRRSQSPNGKGNKSHSAITPPKKVTITLQKYIEDGVQKGFRVQTSGTEVDISDDDPKIKTFITDRDLQPNFFTGIVSTNFAESYKNIINSIKKKKVIIPNDFVQKYTKGINDIEKLLNIIYEYADKKKLLEKPSDGYSYVESGVTYLARAHQLTQLYDIYNQMVTLSGETPTFTEETKEKATGLFKRAKQIGEINFVTDFY
jgi:hypothetical protein